MHLTERELLERSLHLAMGVLRELGTDGHDASLDRAALAGLADEASELLMELDGIMDPVDQN
jgi:hypothetical protein